MREMVLNVVVQSAFAALLIFAFYGWGCVINKKIGVKFHTVTEEVFLMSTLGIAVIIAYTALLGLLHILYRPFLFILPAGLFGLRYSRIRIRDVFWLAGIGLLLLPVLFFTLYPPNTWDDVSYHLPIAQSLLTHHGIVFTEYLRFPVFPLNGELLFSIGLAIDEKRAQLISWICLYLICLGGFSAVEKRFNKTWGGLAVVLIISSQLLFFVSSICYVDVILTLFVTAAIIAFAHYDAEGVKSWNLLAAIFIGMAAGTKYSSLIVLLGMLLYLAVKKDWTGLLRLASISGIVALPWYLRNYYYSLNPIWPFLSNQLGYIRFWDMGDFQGQVSELTSIGFQKSFKNFLLLPYLLGDGKYLMSTMGTMISDLIRLPMHIAEGEATVNPLVWLGMTGALLTYKRRDKELAVFGFSFLFYMLLWFVSVSERRYFLPVVPIGGIIAAIGFAETVKGRTAVIRYGLLIVLFFLSIRFPLSYAERKYSAKGRPVDIEQAQPLYRAVHWASEKEGMTYGYLCEYMNYYGNGKVIGDWFGIARYGTVTGLLQKPGQLHAHLSGLGVRYFLLNKRRMAPDELQKMKLNGLFNKVYEDDSADIYELTRTNGSLPCIGDHSRVQ